MCVLCVCVMQVTLYSPEAEGSESPGSLGGSLSNSLSEQSLASVNLNNLNTAVSSGSNVHSYTPVKTSSLLVDSLMIAASLSVCARGEMMTRGCLRWFVCFKETWTEPVPPATFSLETILKWWDSIVEFKPETTKNSDLNNLYAAVFVLTTARVHFYQAKLVDWLLSLVLTTRKNVNIQYVYVYIYEYMYLCICIYLYMNICLIYV